MKKKIFCTILLIITFIFELCSFKVSTIKINKNSPIINTSQLMIVSANDLKNTSYKKLNIENKTISDIHRTEMPAFSTSVLSKDSNFLYFTKVCNDKTTQLYQVNLSSKEEKQITSKDKNNIYKIEDFFINESTHKAYLRTKFCKQNIYKLVMLNLQNNEMKVLDKLSNDNELRFLDYSESKGKFLIGYFSLKDRLQKTNNSNQNQIQVQPPVYHFAFVDESLNNFTEICTTTDFVTCMSLYPDASSMLITISNPPIEFKGNGKLEICEKNLKTGETKAIVTNSEKYNVIKDGKVSNNGKGIFFISYNSKNKDSIINDTLNCKVETLNYYDFNTKNISKLYNFKDSMLVNYSTLGNK